MEPLTRDRLPCSALAVLALIFSAGVLGFSIGRDLPQPCPTTQTAKL